MTTELSDVIGFRGERFVELCLTSFVPEPLFRPGFLGDKWPAIDLYVELTTIPEKRPYFFGQVKATTSTLTDDAESLTISTKKDDIARLLRIPGPTYIFGVHVPSGRVFIRSVHDGIAVKAITRIPVSYELRHDNLQQLQREVADYWMTTTHKPTNSVFL